MKFLQKLIIDKITHYRKISLFFHEIPDFDALGSCFALKRFIKDKFPEKEVHIIGLDILDETFSKGFFEFNLTHVNNDFIRESLGIILDVANETRIWTTRHRFCKELIRIDHHPQIESIAQIEWIDSESPATCEMVGMLLYEWDSKIINPNTAMYLYAGILTDTARFLYPSTRPETLELCSRLIATNFDRQKLNDILYLRSLKQTTFESRIMTLLKFDKSLGFGYAILPKNIFNKYNIQLRMSMVHVFNNIEGLNAWMTIYYDDSVHKWRGSIRSRTIQINTVAEKYHGGGHKLAAGFTLDNYSQARKIINDMKKMLKEQINNMEQG